MNESQHIANLNNIQAEINRLSLAAFGRLIELLKSGEKSPRDAIAEIQAGFTGQYQSALLEAFNKILITSIGAAELKNLNISGLKLSDKLYQHSQSVQATALRLINDHTKGFQDSRKLALQLYEGYNFRAEEPLKVKVQLPKYLRAAFGDDEAFKALWNKDYTGSKLKGLADHFEVGPELARIYARIQAGNLKTPALRAAYLQALDALEQGAGQRALANTLKTAVHERNRYFANRIAQTELHRAHTDQYAAEIMADEGFDYVQIKLSATHPRLDICDYHTGLDAYGLGPGIYPKAQAPKPPFHPFCRCLLRPRASVEGKERFVPDAGQKALSKLPANDARQIMGSADKLEQLLKGKDIDAILNAGIDPQYHFKRLGEFISTAKPDMLSNMTKNDFEIAQSGGRHHGFLNDWSDKKESKIKKTMGSLQKNIEIHQAKIKNLYDYIDRVVSEQELNYLISVYWPKEIRNFLQQINILKEILRERNNDKK
ncbi:MAG: hypothetical protein KGZ88_11895 [Methylomicrobium sp.]|nr:hypothetical protein [Methylomicrobium sp.]